MANTIYARLSFDFDTTKFGGAHYLSPEAKNSLNVFPSDVVHWQTQEIANGTIAPSNYFKNPVQSVCTSITSNTNLIITFCNNDIANTFPNTSIQARNLANTANSLLIQILDFKSHTDNMSRLGTTAINTASLTDTPNIPNYQMAMAQGSELTRLLYSTESAQNTNAILGCFTSIFVNPELTANSWNIGNGYISLTNSYNGVTSNITNSALVSIISTLEQANSLMLTRRTADWNFYKKQKQILNDYRFVTQFNNSGNTDNYLIQNYIGTDFLKNNLANT
jgi:hypothetical protein